MAGKKRPAWVTAAIDQRRAEIRDECDRLGLDIRDPNTQDMIQIVMTCIQSAYNDGIVPMLIEVDAWIEETS